MVTGKLRGQKDVAGLLTGTRNFDWKGSQSAILPGAICENLTSFGGKFDFNDGQQRLNDFLAGAAGASGAVVEPFAIARNSPIRSCKSTTPAAARWPRPFTRPWPRRSN